MSIGNQYGFKKDLEILIIDDQEFQRNLLNLFLRELGFNPILALDGYDAIKLAGKHRFDIIFTNYRMRDINGVETMKRIECLLPASEMPYYVACTTPEYVEDCVAAGMDDYLSRDLSMYIVEKKMRSILLKLTPPAIPSLNSKKNIKGTTP